MKKIGLILTPQQASNVQEIERIARKKAKLPHGQVVITRKSIDARKKQVKINVEALVGNDREVGQITSYRPSEENVAQGKQVIIVGSGPAGLFAAIRLIELGIKPIILERGKDVQDRRKDLARINKEGVVDADSNYCFGEGGAGTYSDGKLYTRSKKRGNVRRVLEVLHYHGAPDEILYEAHPHIGTNKLPKIIASLREYILDRGGEVHFNARVEGLIIEKDEIKGVKTTDDTYKGEAVILATGHSARDIYQLLEESKVYLEPKPFALGVRVEHPQGLIDSIQYHCDVRGPYLPAAAYSLVSQVEYDQSTTGVFSFCMCPGGFIVPAATAPGEVVVNGMSPSRRDSKFANSGIVVSIDDKEVGKKYGESPLRYMYYQQEIEQTAFAIAGGTLAAPAQRLTDFVAGRLSANLPETSYVPGTSSVLMDEVLPATISERLKRAFKKFDKKMRGYLNHEAVMLGVESRTSSPVRIPRDKESFEHIGVKRLFPAGEGAGYAGGIVSAAIDGEKCAEKAAILYGKVENV